MFRPYLAIALLSAAAVAGACAAPDDLDDDLAGERADEGEEGKADAAGTFTYFEIHPDYRRCVYPLCGGYWVARVNRAETRCADGRWADRCYVAELDVAGLGLARDEDLDALYTGIGARAVIVRGSIAHRTFPEYGNLGRFVATEAWRAGTASSADGVWVKVEPNGVRCVAAPCEDLGERKLNSGRHANIADLDFVPSGATEDELAAAWDAVTGDGLIVVGDRYTVRANGRRAKGRTVTQFYTRIHATQGDPTQGDPTQGGGCYVGGCSSQVCSDDPGVITTCEWRPEYACYRDATCERQPTGACGWTPTPELEACLASPQD